MPFKVACRTKYIIMYHATCERIVDDNEYRYSSLIEEESACQLGM